MQLPVALAYMATNPPSDRRVEFGTTGWNVYQAVQSALIEIDTATRHRGVRHRKRIRSAEEELSVRLFAANVRSTRGQYVTEEERLDFGISVLTEAVFGRRKTVMDEKFDKYLRDLF